MADSEARTDSKLHSLKSLDAVEGRNKLRVESSRLTSTAEYESRNDSQRLLHQSMDSSDILGGKGQGGQQSCKNMREVVSAQPTYHLQRLNCLTFLKAWMIRLLSSCSGEMDEPLIVIDGMVPERGLPNYGNTCYINTVLQIVVHLDAEFLGSHAPGAKCARPCAGCLLYHFLIKYRAGLPLNLEHLTREISCFQNFFVRKEMDDCYFFWVAVVERLPSSCFQLSYRYKKTCRECNFQEIDKGQDKSYSIPLVIGAKLNFFESLDAYFSSSVTALGCDCCGSNSGLLKSLQIVTLPNILAFQAGLYDDNGNKCKCSDSFPPFLDMGPYIDDEGFFYALHGVIVHRGDTRHAGHYICYVKSDCGWVIFVEEETVLEKQAYMLVYVRDEASTSASPPCNLVPQIIRMGFPKRIVEKAIQENGESNTELILEFLLKHSVVDKSSSECDNAPYNFGHPSDTHSWFESKISEAYVSRNDSGGNVPEGIARDEGCPTVRNTSAEINKASSRITPPNQQRPESSEHLVGLVDEVDAGFLSGHSSQSLTELNVARSEGPPQDDSNFGVTNAFRADQKRFFFDPGSNT